MDEITDTIVDDALDEPRLRIGALGAELGLSPKTIRFYEEIGLLDEPARSAGGYRLYTAADRERLHFVMKAKQVGFSLAEIADILTLQGRGTQPCGHVVGLLDEKLRGVDEQLRALTEYRDRLLWVRSEAASRARESACVCGIIEHEDASRPSDTAPPPQPLVNRVPGKTAGRSPR